MSKKNKHKKSIGKSKSKSISKSTFKSEMRINTKNQKSKSIPTFKIIKKIEEIFTRRITNEHQKQLLSISLALPQSAPWREAFSRHNLRIVCDQSLSRQQCRLVCSAQSVVLQTRQQAEHRAALHEQQYESLKQKKTTTRKVRTKSISIEKMQNTTPLTWIADSREERGADVAKRHGICVVGVENSLCTVHKNSVESRSIGKSMCGSGMQAFQSRPQSSLAMKYYFGLFCDCVKVFDFEFFF